MAPLRRVLAALALAAAMSAVANAAGESERRLGAEVAVLLGDARRLAEPLPDSQRAGLIARLKGRLASLPLLVRQARDANPALPAPPPDAVAGTRTAIGERNLLGVISGLAALARLYPFNTTGILPVEETPERLRLGAAIHRETCAACHDQPDPQAALPAHDLFTWARMQPVEEFAARLYIGVRGDALTGLANPLGAVEIAALIAFYRTGKSE